MGWDVELSDAMSGWTVFADLGIFEGIEVGVFGDVEPIFLRIVPRYVAS